MGIWTQGNRIGRFTLSRMLGEGAHAEVWLAIERGAAGFQRQVALKLLKADDDEALIGDLLREARLTASLRHPNIVDVFSVGETDGVFWLAMEYIDEGTLRELTSRVKRAQLGYPVSVILDLGIGIARGLAMAHTATDDDGQPLQVVHRDLKPENILLDPVGTPLITDFGVAKVIGERTATKLGVVKGTSRYVPPEIWTGGRDFQPRGDLFALGCILFELVTLRRLFDGPMQALLEQITKRTATAEAKQVSELVPDLGPIVERLLQRDPNARYQSADEVASDLEAVQAGRPAPADLTTFAACVRLCIDSASPEPRGSLEPASHDPDPRWRELAVRMGVEPSIPTTDPGAGGSPSAGRSFIRPIPLAYGLLSLSALLAAVLILTVLTRAC
jgi:eukaryotic-like serine/threonine-protein kinase